MDVPLNSDLQNKLAQLAAREGRDTAALVVEAVERMLNHEEWFISEVDKGIAAADSGELVEHDEVRRRIERRYPE